MIRRRYQRGLANFWNHYRPVVDWWAVYDNEHGPPAQLIGEQAAGVLGIKREDWWRLFLETLEHDSTQA